MGQNKPREKNTFGDHFSEVFDPFPTQNPAHDDEVIEFLENPGQLDLPITSFIQTEVRGIISKLNIKKAS